MATMVSYLQEERGREKEMSSILFIHFYSIHTHLFFASATAFTIAAAWISCIHCCSFRIGCVRDIPDNIEYFCQFTDIFSNTFRAIQCRDQRRTKWRKCRPKKNDSCVLFRQKRRCGKCGSETSGIAMAKCSCVHAMHVNMHECE